MSETEYYKAEERDGKHVVVLVETGEVRSEHETAEEARAQAKLMNEIANNPSWNED